MSPVVAFSGDSRLIAAAAGSNVKVWDVATGREVQTLTAGEGGMASSLVGVSFIASAQTIG
jgi:WD40 repeat protein